jgi:hypothetical protein
LIIPLSFLCSDLRQQVVEVSIKVISVLHHLGGLKLPLRGGCFLGEFRLWRSHDAALVLHRKKDQNTKELQEFLF